MGVVTVSIDDEVEKRLREKIDDSKGVLGQTISDAIKEWIERDEEENARKKGKEIIKEGFEMGEIQYENRSELHESRWKKTD